MTLSSEFSQGDADTEVGFKLLLTDTLRYVGRPDRELMKTYRCDPENLAPLHELISRYEQGLWDFFMRVTRGDAAQAESLFQQTWLTAYQEYSASDGDAQAFRRWILRLAIRQAVQVLDLPEAFPVGSPQSGLHPDGQSHVALPGHPSPSAFVPGVAPSHQDSAQ